MRAGGSKGTKEDKKDVFAFQDRRLRFQQISAERSQMMFYTSASERKGAWDPFTYLGRQIPRSGPGKIMWITTRQRTLQSRIRFFRRSAFVAKVSVVFRSLGKGYR